MIIKLPNPLTWLKGKQEIPDVSGQPGQMDHAQNPLSMSVFMTPQQIAILEYQSKSAKAVESVMTIKSFFSALKADVIAMWKKAPSEEVALASAVNAAVPYIEEIDVLVVPELAPILNPILDKVKVGLSALKSTIQGAGSKASIPSIVASINANLAALLSAVQVKDPATATKIATIVAIVTTGVSEIGAGASTLA
jgi:hypothetical protein